MPEQLLLEDRIEQLLDSGNTSGASALQHRLGLICFSELHDTDKALTYLLKALEGCRDTARSLVIREDLARLYTAHGYYIEALDHFQVLLEEYTSRNDRVGTALIANAMANIYATRDSLQQAIPLYTRVEELLEKISSPVVGDRSAELMDYERTHTPVVSELFHTSIMVLTRKGLAIAGITDTTELDFGGLIDNETDLHALNILNSGHRYKASGATALAEAYYKMCLSGDNVDEAIQRDALYKLGEIAKERQDWIAAYDYLDQYSSMNDSLINDRRQRLIDRMQVMYRTAEQETRIRDLMKDQKILEFQNRFQNVLTFSLLFGSVVVLFGAYFTIRNYQHRFNANQIIHHQTEEINRQRITELENNVKIQSMHSMIQGQEVERERVAKDLHDSLGGLLSTVKLHFDVIQSQDERIGRMPEYQRAYTLLDDACKEVRHISNNLQPNALHRMGLVPAINDLINRIQTTDTPKIHFYTEGLNGVLDPRISLNVFRIVQELLNNALKHAGASEIQISLMQMQDRLTITVQDNGKGYEPSETAKGMGTENIASRVNYLKGDLSIHSVIGEGTSTQIEVPLN